MAYAIAFDVELDRLVPNPDGSEISSPWHLYDAPHITCAATFSEHEGSKCFMSMDTGKPAARMNSFDACRLFDELWSHSQQGAIIISWGGTAVDFRALHALLDPGRQKQCIDLVKRHIDIPIASATDIGMMMGLDAAATGMGQGRKITANSSSAPIHWKQGKHLEVAEHVKKDAMLTLKVYNSIIKNFPPSLTWKTRSGKERIWWCSFRVDNLIVRLPNVMECMALPLPFTPFVVPPGMNRDVSVQWMSRYI